MKRHWISKMAFAMLIALLVLATMPAFPARAAAKTASATGSWNNTSTWGGGSVPNSNDDVTINSGVIVTIPGGYSAACKSINFTTGTAGLSSITLADSTSSLTVSGPVTIPGQGSSGNINQINVGAGTVSASSVDLAATTDASRFSQILISSGTVNVTGDITSAGTASRITFSGAGRINAGGTFMSGSAGTFTPSSGTVNFNATGGQTVGAYTYNNLMLSGGGTKSLPAGISVNGNLSIAESVKVSVATGQNISVGTLNLAGLGTANGTWGSTSSNATYKTDTYFAATNGTLTISTDTRATQTPLTVTGPTSVTYGSNGTIIKTGGSGTGTVTYSQGASSGCTVNTTTGVITVSSVLGDCTVTVTKAADANYLETNSDGFHVNLLPRAVTLTGTRQYDTTPVVVAAILSVSNKAKTADNVTVASGTATLASANVGTRSITSMGSLTLGGVDAANYTLSGASGSVEITQADQAPLVVTGPASLTYGTSGTITFTGGSGTGAMSFSHGSSTGCTVDASTGVITVTDASLTCTVTATKAGDSNYNAATSAGFGVTLKKANQLSLVVTGPTSITYGTTGTIATSGGSGTGALTYSHGSSTGCTVNPSSGVITMTDILGSCTVMATKAADGNYNTATSAGFKVTLAPRAVILTGTRKYDKTTAAAAGILSITNSMGTDAVSVASGSAVLASANVGNQSITSMGTLTLGGAAAANYTLIGASGSVTITKADQTITFPAPASPAAYNSTFTVTPSSSSGLTVTVNASGVCTIVGFSVTITSGAGTCTLTASQPGDANNNPATNVTQTITAQKAEQTPLAITGPASLTYGTTATITFSGGSGTGAVSYSQVTSNTGCAVNVSTGMITVTNASLNCLVIVTKAGDDNYNMASSAGIVTLIKAAQAPLVVTGPASLTYGTTGTITFTGGSGTGTISYSHGLSNGCTADASTGLITVTNASGNCSVTVIRAADNNYLETASAGFAVSLNKAEGSISISNIPGSAVYGGNFTPAFTKLGDGVTFVVSLTTGTCTLTTAGVVNFIGLGTCTLQASVAEGTNYLAAWGTKQSFSIGKANQTIIFTSTAPVMAIAGKTYIPTATGGASGNVVTFTIDPAASLVCSISDGTVSFNAEGNCIINANQAGDDYYNAAPQVQQSIVVMGGFVIYLPQMYMTSTP